MIKDDNILFFFNSLRSEFHEPMDLQLDYWTMTSRDDKETGSGVTGLSGLVNIVESQKDSRKSVPGSCYGDSGTKASIKTSIWQMQIQRLGVQSVSDQPTFTMQYYLKEKKSKGKFRLNRYILRNNNEVSINQFN